MNLPFTYYHNGVKSHKTIFLLHGTGGNEKDLLPLVEDFVVDYSVVGLLGNIREHGLPRFFKRLAEGVFDQQNIKEEVEKMREFVESWYSEYSISAKDAVFIGYSNGANFILAMLFAYPKLVQNAVVMHPMLPYTPQEKLDLSHSSILVTTGKHDPIIPYAESIKLVEELKEHNAKTEIIESNEGHNITYDEVTSLHAFIQKIL